MTFSKELVDNKALLFFIIPTSPFTQPMVLRYAQMNYTTIILNWTSNYWVSWWIEGENGEMSDGGMAGWLCQWTKDRGRKAIMPANTSIHHINCMTFFRVIITGCMLWPFVSFQHLLNCAIWWTLAEIKLYLLSLGLAYAYLMFIIRLSLLFSPVFLSPLLFPSLWRFPPKLAHCTCLY